MVSDLGRIKSLDRYVPAYSGLSGKIEKYFRKGRILKQTKHNSGYLTVTISDKEGKANTYLVHRLVAMTFLGEKEGLDINHKDENKYNNSVENLEWCTRKYNINYGTGVERRKKLRRRVAQYTLSGEFVMIHPSIRAVAKSVGVDSSTIKGCCNHKRGQQQSAGYKWEYVDNKAFVM